MVPETWEVSLTTFYKMLIKKYSIVVYELADTRLTVFISKC